MAEDTGQERTEDPTEKKKKQAKEKGQVARSKEFSAVMVLLLAGLAALYTGPYLLETVVKVAFVNFGFTQQMMQDPKQMPLTLLNAIRELAPVIITFMAALSASALAAAILVGGWNVSFKSMSPSFSKMNPIAGMKRIFSVNGLMELAKALAKFTIIGGAGGLWILVNWPHYLDLSIMGVNDSMIQALEQLIAGFMILVASTSLIAAIDVPFQIIQNANKLKMTKQEVKEEYKDSEGKPEVKQKVKQLQRELSQRRMMAEVPKADVVITNPDHFAVALSYAVNSNAAPKVIAKGGDQVAFKIKEIAQFHNVTCLESPLLCRAIYFTTKLDQEIPHGLYKAVAQILAYVFQLKDFNKGRGDRPYLPKKLDIPTDYKNY